MGDTGTTGVVQHRIHDGCAGKRVRTLIDIPDSFGAPTAANQCAVLGKPIAHSLSPVLHQAAYRALGIQDSWSYHRYEVGEDALGGFLEELDDSWRGLSLTMPLKRTIQPYGIPSNTWAKHLGVANTVVFDWQTPAVPGPATDAGLPFMRLYNTDVDGIDLAIRHAWDTRGGYPSNVGRLKALVIGNGNTAMSAIAALSQLRTPQGATVGGIAVAARHPEHNRDILALRERPASSGMLRVDAIIGLDAVAATMNDYQVIISTLPAHAADDLAAQLAASGLHVDGTLLDVAYVPHPSQLNRAWEQAGGISIGGEEMLLYQAIGQVCLMAGRGAQAWSDGGPVDVRQVDSALEDAMRAALREAIQ